MGEDYTSGLERQFHAALPLRLPQLRFSGQAIPPYQGEPTMRNAYRTFAPLALACALLFSVHANAGDLDRLLSDINVRASVDLGAFKADLSATFGTSGPKIDGLFELVSDPADVYMILRLGELAKQPLEHVVTEHQSHAGQGWGVIAKSLGIKPGSREFHALKDNRLDDGGSSGKNGKGKGKS
jgi:hypothetical protein